MYLHEQTLGRLPRPPRPPGMHHRNGHHHRPFVMVQHTFPHELTRTELDDYQYDGQLGGFGKKLKKAVKKVTAPAAHIAAAWFTGGASLALSANILKAQQQRKAQEAQARAQSETDRAAIAAQEKIAIAQSQSNVAPPVSQTMLTPSIAPPAGLVQQMMPMPTSTGGGYTAYEPLPGTGGQPKWLIPAALGGGGLLLAFLISKRR